MSWFNCQREGQAATVRIFGEIGMFADVEAFKAAIGDAKQVRLTIDSSGGCSSTGLEACEFLRTRDAVAEVTGRCYSSALFLAMGCRRIVARHDAKFLVHAPVNHVVGDAEVLAMESKAMRKLTDRIAAAIAERTRQPLAIVESWLAPGVDKYFTAVEALAVGLCDEILPEVAETTVGGLKTSTIVELPKSESVARPLTDQEQLFHDMLRAFGTIKVSDKERFLRELEVFATYNVTE